MGKFGVTDPSYFSSGIVAFGGKKIPELMKGLVELKNLKTPLRKISQLIKDDTKE
jgi:hypothetical protein